MQTNFKVGDEVEAFGVRGSVSEIVRDICRYPLRVAFEITPAHTTNSYFTMDGKLDTTHKEPALKLISRPEKFVEKTFYRAVIKSDWSSSITTTQILYKSKEEVLSLPSLPREKIIGYTEEKVFLKEN